MSVDLTGIQRQGNASVLIYDDPEDSEADKLLCSEVGRTLHENYPGYQWFVDVPPNQGVVIIRNVSLDPRGNMGFNIKRKDIYDIKMQTVMGGGEFLERYNAKRGAMDPAQFEGRNMHLVKPEM